MRSESDGYRFQKVKEQFLRDANPARDREPEVFSEQSEEAMNWGTLQEPVVRDSFAMYLSKTGEYMHVSAGECGLVIHPDPNFKYIAASNDGVLMDERKELIANLEIKVAYHLSLR